MADTSTIPKRFNHNSLQRIEAADVNTLATTGQDYVAELIAAIFSNEGGVIDGFNVTYSGSGRVLNVARGAAIWKGYLVKDTQASVKQVTLSANGSSDARIDVLYIAGTAESDSDSASKVSLSSYSRTTLGSPFAVGTGDSSTKAWDLGHAGIDPRTLKIKLAGDQVGGWNYSQGTGGSGKDQVIFADAPSAVAITAEYTYESGGAESAGSLYTRKSVIPDIRVAAGTPDPSPSVPSTPDPNSDIVLAHITVPGSYSTGAPTTIDNTVKKFLLHPDINVDPAPFLSAAPPNINAPRSGRLGTLLRGFDQVITGGRLKYNDTDEIAVTPLWAALGGQAVHFGTSEVTLTLQSSNNANPGYVDATGWWYAYLTQAVDSRPGSTPALFVSQSPPNSRRRESNTNSGLYVGAIYLSAYTPSVAVQPFYTHGDWVYWEDPDAIIIDTGTNNINVSAWCPPTGRLLDTRVAVDYTPEAEGDTFYAIMKSHRSATAKEWPQYTVAIEPIAGGGNVLGYGNGHLRAEDYEGSRYVHATRSNSAGTVESAALYVMGYLDDHRTMDSTALSDASPTFY
jgi:hypothetical protein